MKLFQNVVSFGRKVASKVNEKYAAAAAAIGFALGGAVPAHADLATDLGAVTTSATTGIAAVSTNQVTIMEAIFGLVIFSVGFAWLLTSTKKK